MGFGVTGPLVGGGSDRGPWLNRLGGSGGEAVATDVLARMPSATTVGGIIEYGSTAIAVLGSSADGDVPLELLASTNDVDWAVVTPATIDQRLRPVGLVATGGAVSLVGASHLDGDPPTTRITVYVTRGGRRWMGQDDPLLELAGRSNLKVAASGDDLIIVASAPASAFSVGPPILLIGHDDATTWDSHVLSDLAGATIASAVATRGRLLLAGCGATDPPTASVWTYELADPRSVDTRHLASDESCASAIVSGDDGYVVVGSVGASAAGWQWQAAGGLQGTVSFPRDGSNMAARSLAAKDGAIVAVGSTLPTPGVGADGEQHAAAWVATGSRSDAGTP